MESGYVRNRSACRQEHIQGGGGGRRFIHSREGMLNRIVDSKYGPPPQRVWFSSSFGRKNKSQLFPFWPEIGCGFAFVWWSISVKHSRKRPGKKNQILTELWCALVNREPRDQLENQRAIVR